MFRKWKKVAILLELIAYELYLIRHALTRPIRIRIRFGKGDLKMPLTMKVGQTVTVAPVEEDAVNGSVAILDPAAIQWTSSDAAVGTFSPDDNSGGSVLTAHAPGTTTLTVLDPGNGLTATETVTVESLPAVKIAIEFGTPTP